MGVKLLGKSKIHEIAKELDLTSKEVMARANEMGIEAKSHLSSIKEEDRKKLVESLQKEPKVKLEKKENKQEKENKSSKKDTKKGETPVIIRREVIISEEEIAKQEEEEKKRKQLQKKQEVGFVERDKNKDFNIVYRNKPTKPLTVSELFGLKKENKEEVKKEERPLEKANMEQVKEKIEISEKDIVSGPIEQQEVVEEKNTIVEGKKKDITPKNEYSNSRTATQAKITSNGYQHSNNRNQNHQSTYPRSNQNGPSHNGYQNRNGYQNNNQNSNYQNNGYRGNSNNNGYQNRNQNQNGNYSNNGYRGNTNNNQNHNGYRNNQNGAPNNNYQNNGYRNNQGNNDYRNNNQNRFGDNRQNNRNGFNRGERRPLDERGIEKNIKNIMATDIVEKEVNRDYNNRAIDKEKINNKFEENKNKKTRARKSERFAEFDEEKLKDLKQADRLSHMFNEQDGGMLDYYDLTTARGKRNRKKQGRNEQQRVKQKIFKLTEITIPDNVSVKDLAIELKKTSGDIIKKLLNYGIMATINNEIDFDTAFLIASEFGVTAIKKETVTEEDILFDESEDEAKDLLSRPPVVVVMGHVDHGKTSLLDAIRSTNVIEGEAGGITQHIGAYKVNIKEREITFLDTPGHEAFTAMRARGAQITDIAILVVAADDGVMPQTVEAINHAKAAGIPIIVAVNKIDLPGANIDKIKQELMKYELVPEEWGGDTIFVPISAKKHMNIEQLLEMVLLVADMKELKANPDKQAKGVVIEARLDKTKGPIASILVQRGTLDEGDTIVVGSSIGRIRAMKDDKARKVKKAGPSTPVEVMGLTEVPEAGDIFYEVKDEKTAKHLIEKRKRQVREQTINTTSHVTLDDLFNQIKNQNLKQLNLIVKADVQGTVEAVKQSLEKLSNEDVKVKVIHSNAGSVTESDVTLAKVANAIIIAFNVRPNLMAKEVAEKEEVEIKQYSVIYQAIEDVEAAMKGLLDPVFEEKVIGTAQVRQTFKVTGVGTIAGAYVLEGKVERNAGVRIIRENVVIHEGKLASLKRFKEDVKEVAKGYECGIQIENYNDIKEGDQMEAYVMEEVKK